MAAHHYGGALERTISDIQAGKPVEPLAREAARLVLRNSTDGSLVALAGVVSADEAVRAGVRTPDGRIWLNRSIADLRKGLSTAPADGFAWLRLAGAEFVVNGPSQNVVEALRMTSYTLRNNFDAAPLLLSLSSAMWPRLEPDFQAAARAAVLKQWNSKRYRPRLHQLALTESGRILLQSTIGDTEELRGWIDNRIAIQRGEKPARPGQPILRR